MAGKITKIYTIEIGEGDEVFIGSDIPATSEQEAINKMMFMFIGRINQNSELIYVEENRIH